MTKACSLACGLPFCQSAQNTQSKQTNLSLSLRTAAIALGIIAVVAGILVLCGIGQLSNTIGWSMLVAGGISIILGTSVKCINNKTDIHTTSADRLPDNTAKNQRSPHDRVILDLNNRTGRERELQEDISISEDTVLKIQNCMKNILKKNEEGGIKFYSSQNNHCVFALDTAPDLIFKMKTCKDVHSIGRDDSMAARYKTMINARKVCHTHQLSLLDIPNAKLFTVQAEGEEFEIIAERKLDINPSESAQEQYYEDNADSLDAAVSQLATFICITGYSDVTWRNNPILNNSVDAKGNRKFALIDIEEMDGAEIGLFGGGLDRRGLVRCVNERQGQIVQDVAKKNKINTSSFANAHAQRKEELADWKKLKQYYSTRNIAQGDEPIVVDVESIDFPYAPEKTQKLREIAANIINAINTKTRQSSPEESIKGRRHLLINTNKNPFAGLEILIEPGEDARKTANAFKTDKEYYDATYLGCVVNKLIEMGLIYKLVDYNGHGWYLQA